MNNNVLWSVSHDVSLLNKFHFTFQISILHIVAIMSDPCLCWPGLPSAPQDLSATTSGGKLLLSWSPPEDTGGRSDITYSVECERCEGSLCQPCGEKVRYEPASSGLTDTRVSVSELDAHLNYTFRVEAHSGVSVLSGPAQPRTGRPPSSSALTTSLENTGEPDAASSSAQLPQPLYFTSQRY